MNEKQQIVISPEGTDDNPDNHPNHTSRAWAIQTRAALIQTRKALQEQIRAVGMQIAALEKEYGIGDLKIT
jgi:hypothetical protein